MIAKLPASSIRLSLLLALSCSLVGPGAFTSAHAQDERGPGSAFQHLRKPDNPEAVAIFLNLLARYAADAGDKGELEQRMALALSEIPRSREIAQRLVDNFRSVPPAVRQAAFGSFADPLTLPYGRESAEAAFKEMLTASGPANPETSSLAQPRVVIPVMTPTSASAATPPQPQRPPSQGQPTPKSAVPIRIRFKGFKCFGETSDVREGGSDEIYVIAGVYGDYMVKLPLAATSVFEGIDAGEVQNGPITAVGAVPPKALTLIVYVWNHNFSDPSQVREGIEILLKAAQSFGDPYVAVAAKIVGAIASWAFTKDRLIQEIHVLFDADRLEAMAATPPREYEGILNHFDTYHTDGDASYAVYFDLFREGTTPGPVVVANTRWSASGTRSVPGVDVEALAPREGHIDVFGVSADGVARTAWWEPGSPGFSEWYRLHPETSFMERTSVTSLVPRGGHIDLFAVSADGVARTAWWEPGAQGFSEWFPLHPETRFSPGATLTPLVPRDGHIDLFGISDEGVARTAWWEGGTGWSEWYPLHPEARFPSGAPVAAFVPREGHIDLFAVGTDGVVRTAWWEAETGWSEWFALHPETRFSPGAAITALVPREGHIDLFGISADGVARTAWWEPATGWSEWYPLHPETRFSSGATVTALVPRDGHIDLFAVSADGVARTAWWDVWGPGWSEWFPLHPETGFPSGASVSALVPRQGHIDLFAVGADGVARTAWWEAQTGWSEWFPMHDETKFRGLVRNQAPRAPGLDQRIPPRLPDT